MFIITGRAVEKIHYVGKIESLKIGRYDISYEASYVCF